MEALANPATATPPLKTECGLTDEQTARQVRELHQDTAREICYLTTVANPFSGNDQNIDIYADNHDFEYWFSRENGRLIQASPRAGLHQASHPSRPLVPLTVTELRERALEVAERHEPGFRQSISSYHPFEENRRSSLYLFRWESGSVDDDEIPPFIQVGLFANGTLACFTDAL